MSSTKIKASLLPKPRRAGEEGIPHPTTKAAIIYERVKK
jgi:hypothetical protein